LKNADDIVANILPFMEWNVNQNCLKYGECEIVTPLVAQNKPMFHIDYPDGAPNFTPDVKA
jgi:hypothetical protein